jgi:hypothetical protein
MVVSLSLQIPHGRRNRVSSIIGIEKIIEDKRRRQKQQKKVEKKKIPIPRYIVSKGGYRGSKSKDKRYSNQQMIRRMYRNS